MRLWPFLRHPRIPSHRHGPEAGLDLRGDIDAVTEPGLVMTMEPLLTIPEGQPGAGGCRRHDIFLVTGDGTENLTVYPCGTGFNVVG